MILAIALAASAAATPLETTLSGAAGIYAALPGAGVRIEAVAGADGVLQVRGAAGAYARVRAWPTAFNAFYPLVATGSLELAVGRPVGRYSRVGPALAVDALVIHAAEQDCDGACRFNTFLGGQRGPALAGALGVGGRWSRHAAHTLELGFALEPAWVYDMGMLIPRLDLDWTLPSGWQLGLNTSRYEAALALGRALGGQGGGQGAQQALP